VSQVEGGDDWEQDSKSDRAEAEVPLTVETGRERGAGEECDCPDERPDRRLFLVQGLVRV
jgi:hypothetical protein